MKILVTGNMGYVGPMVVRQLRQSYPTASIFGLDLGFFAQCLTINGGLFPECRVDAQYFADVRNIPEMLLDGIDAIVHLAAISNDPMGNCFEEATLDINYRASVELARKAKSAGVGSFVFASSCSVYGLADEGPRTELSAVNPLTAYAKSKVFTERGLASLADSAFKVTCLRFGTACGMSDRLRLDLVLNDFVACGVASKRIVILSDGTPWRPLISVKDMARAIDWAISRPSDAGEDFLVVNTGSDLWNFQVKDLAAAVARVLSGVEVSINSGAQPDKRSYRVDFSRFRALAPNHQPKADLDTTILELKKGLEGIGFHDSHFRDSAYMRLNVLKRLRSQGWLNDRLEWLPAVSGMRGEASSGVVDETAWQVSNPNIV
ncbi:MAG: SDR family oxidoreductase [Acidobacteriota bacterium]